ncbi:competence protein ComEC [Desulfitispora alkaliphila]|uniref:DNA internalization-related competence protein ComEC/Rec2 n=1 Tax=Desulfitispora alkaliphila TaxID=622674 RepID=UPI003D1A0BB3
MIYFITLGWLIGLVVGYLQFGIMPQLLLFFGTAIILSVFIIASSIDRGEMKNNNRKLVILLTLVAAIAGSFWFSLNWNLSKTELSQFFDKDVTATGVVAGKVEVYSNRIAFPLDLEGLKAGEAVVSGAEKTAVSLYSENPEQLGESIKYGYQLMLQGTLRQPSEASNPNAFDYRHYLLTRGIFSQLLVGEDSYTVLNEGKGNPVVFYAHEFNRSTTDLIDSFLPTTQGAVMKAMVFGDKGGLTEEQSQLFMQTGLMHLFAVSGLHVGFVLAFGLGLGRIMRLGKWQQFLLSLVLIWFYACATGFSVSVTRAALMSTVGLYVYTIQRNKGVFSALALALLVVTISNPLLITDPGFQLSFTATWGILYLTPLLNYILRFLPSWRIALTVPLAAQISLIPLLVYHFNLLSPVTILANVFVAPIVGLVVIAGLISLPLSFISNVAVEIIFTASGGALFYLWLLLEEIATLPGSTFYFPVPQLYWIVLYYLALIYLREWYAGNLNFYLIRIFKWRLETGGKAIAFTLLVLLIVTPAQPAQNYLQVTVLDVGQGDAIHVRTPEGKNMLVDGGGVRGSSFDVGERVLIPYLRSEGVNKIDLLVNTHGHYDHTAGLIAVLESFEVKEALISPVPASTETYERFLDLLLEAQVPTTMAVRGQKIYLDSEIDIEVIHPGENPSYSNAELNNSSVVLRIVYGEQAVLLTGDIELEAMGEIARLPMDIGSNIYKVSHHGSRTGLEESFLDAIDTQVGIISTGPNPFGHPHPELINELEQRDIKVYRTDQEGAITVKITPSSYVIETAN